MRRHISYFDNALLEYYHCIKLGVKQSSSRTEKTNWQSQLTRYFKMSTTGTNTSMQACWSLVNCVINHWLHQASPHMQQTLSQLINLMNVAVTSYLRIM